jgi:hypothetical protein
VTRDIVVELGTSPKAEARPDHAVRVILVKAEPHQKTGGRKGGTAGPPSDGILRIATEMLDVPADVIADIYKHRWAVEKDQADYTSSDRWCGTFGAGYDRCRRAA